MAVRQGEENRCSRSLIPLHGLYIRDKHCFSYEHAIGLADKIGVEILLLLIYSDTFAQMNDLTLLGFESILYLALWYSAHFEVFFLPA